MALLFIGLSWAALGVADIVATETASRAGVDLVLFVLPGLFLAIYGCRVDAGRRRRSEQRRVWEDAQ